MDDRLERVIRQQLRKAGKQFEEARRAYTEGKGDPDGDEIFINGQRRGGALR